MNDQNTSPEVIAKLIEESFGDAPITELVLLVQKIHALSFSKSLKDSKIVSIAMVTKMSARNVKEILMSDGDPEDFWQIHVLIKEEDTEKTLSVLQHSGLSVGSSERVRAIVDFHSDDGDGSPLQ